MREANEASIPVLVRINGDSVDASVFRCTNHSNCDFTSVRDEEFRNGFHMMSLLETLC